MKTALITYTLPGENSSSAPLHTVELPIAGEGDVVDYGTYRPRNTAFSPLPWVHRHCISGTVYRLVDTPSDGRDFLVPTRFEFTRGVTAEFEFPDKSSTVIVDGRIFFRVDQPHWVVEVRADGSSRDNLCGVTVTLTLSHEPYRAGVASLTSARIPFPIYHLDAAEACGRLLGSQRRSVFRNLVDEGVEWDYPVNLPTNVQYEDITRDAVWGLIIQSLYTLGSDVPCKTPTGGFDSSDLYDRVELFNGLRALFDDYSDH